MNNLVWMHFDGNVFANKYYFLNFVINEKLHMISIFSYEATRILHFIKTNYFRDIYLVGYALAVNVLLVNSMIRRYI